LQTFSKAEAGGSNSTLPISKGGTGGNNFASGQALIGNVSGSLSTIPLDAAPKAESNNLITSGGAYSAYNNAINGTGYYNVFKDYEGEDPWANYAGGLIHLLGKVPILADGSDGFLFIGDFYIFRSAYKNKGTTGLSSPSIYHAKIYIDTPISGSASSNNIKLIEDINFGGNDASSSPYYNIKLGTFTYNSVQYIGLLSQGAVANAANYYYHGYRSELASGLPDKCTGGVTLCFGTNISYNNVTNFVQYAPL
jgi:hypothetical protein